MKKIVMMSMVMAGVLMINACDDDESSQMSPSAAQGTSFLNTDYDLVYFGPTSLGTIDLPDTRALNLGDKLKITGTISFKGPRDQSYTVKEYEGVWEIHHVSKHSINVGNDFAGIAYNGSSGEQIHVEFNQGLIVLIENN
jgi:hypothetical protein